MTARRWLALLLCAALLCGGSRAENGVTVPLNGAEETEPRMIPAQLIQALDEALQGEDDWTGNPSRRALAAVLVWLDFAVADEETALGLDLGRSWAWYDGAQARAWVLIGSADGSLLYSFAYEAGGTELRLTRRETTEGELEAMRAEAPFAERFNEPSDVNEMMSQVERRLSGS